MSYDLEKDLAAVAMIGSTAMVIAVQASSLQELIEIARKQPCKLKMRSQYYEPLPARAEQFQGFVRNEVTKWGKTIRDANIKAD